MSEIKDRLREARRNKGLSQAGLSKLLGVSQASIAAIEAGRNKRPTNLVSIAKALDVSPYWLETGKEDKEIISNATPLGKIEEWDNDTPLSEDDCEAPLYKDVKLSAGNGFADDIEDYNGYKLRFSRNTLRKHGISPENVVCVMADGDSMEPVFPSGATLGIDTGSKNIRDGQIYAINHGGLLRTKILHKLPENKVRIRSYNQSEYPDEEASLDDLSVIGRVFWWSVMV
ncbi:XRE family transcriptional regulator [Neisseria subflava]|uniref:DNA-binding helix-turn-helix protein n=1 Tax=Neisseria subflava NJ9703 TaxID=546268 RepID=A0A9W5IPH7_NEISU|nr:helix-turn-helix transcriptional regulator [Neisseria subflava]EFC51419.1 DNA-binding helix-turn-helix protein [Neisseria subflava NJ9703]DAX53496.1 MAG TPA: Repressor protein CI [Caudoviricetes sp.]